MLTSGTHLDVDAPEGLYKSHHEVPGDGPPHEAAPVIVTQETGRDEQAAGVRPRDGLVLVPPSGLTGGSQD